ncbi:unnamed protein product [Adineta steineri]|uniref:Uncharacterized protein n=2 Tax=Adineta steineri TaxID=433720 RepID=A0A814LFG9_9BILA|nr:unnamed protein product [Adineta steineri]CAF3665814.1 unnamed protein product [Adineta steineri]
MKIFSKEQNNEHQKLINNNDDKCQYHSSRLEWAESSWTRWLHLLCWWWISPTLSEGSKRLLTENDLDNLPNTDKSSFLLHRLESYDWTSTSTWKIIIQEFWQEYILAGLYCLPYLISRIAQPLLLRSIVLSTTNENRSFFTGYIFVILLCLFGILQALFDHQIYFNSMRVGIRIRNALSAIIYKHALSIKSTVWQYTNTGQIINLIANDTSKFEEICSRLHFLWEGPVEAVIIFIFLWWIIHPIPALFAYLVYFLSIIILFLIGGHLSKYRDLKTSCSDKRVHVLDEFIHGYEVIKMYNWEKLMEDRINQIRQNEFDILKQAYYLRALNTIHSFIIVPILALTTFGTAWLLDHRLNPIDCFTVLAFFGLLRNQIMFIMPLLTERLTDVQVASKRIDAFMRLTITQDQYSSSSSNTQKGQISMSNAFFSWYDDQPCLSSLNIFIKPKTFVGIVGSVGCGKSSLLAAILGEMNLINGEVNTNSNSFSYAAQASWIFTGTIRTNILLNRPFDEQRYRNVIYACCLDLDFIQFGVSGDLTMIGERGVNLSGGQKARISLARAIYNEADVYLFDDPLAAVDGTVAKQIYERCFSSVGLLKNKTRLLVTHQTQFLIDADQIIFLSNGHIDEQGYLEKYTLTKDITDEKQTSVLDNLINEPDTQPIITEETTISGKVKWNLWFYLLTAPPLGLCGLFLLIILLILGELFYDGTNYWLSIWLKQSHKNHQDFSAFAYIYFGLIIGTIVIDALRTIFFFIVILYGTNHLHNNMLKGLLYTSIQFFESNSSGRILSRASKDQKVIDELLPTNLLYAIKSSLMSIGATIIICLIKPYILLVIIGLIPFVLILCRFYLQSKSQLKRLESITRSPIYDLLSSSLNGVVTIRTFKIHYHFIELFTNRIDKNTRAYINMQGAARWFALRLNLLSFINTFSTAILLIIFRNEIDSSLIALCLMYTISIPKSFQLSIQQFFDADLLMTSVERIYEYSKLPSEEEEQNNQQRLIRTSPDWPIYGKIQFVNYSLHHRSGLESVLKNLNIEIKSTEKIGIIGRTGAGKSSLFKGIFRFISQSNIHGHILIDDVDISRIKLKHLRSHLSIIPQEPILFSGTLRYNLDPFNIYSDEQCWMALDDVQLKQFITNHSIGLQMFINESGSNLSTGQCQLICIARAILEKNKILLIDEATSSVDKKTDDIIQKVITNKFHDRTVLTIAHRLNTVAKCDRILVLDKGIIVNFDTPMNILNQYL